MPRKNTNARKSWKTTTLHAVSSTTDAAASGATTAEEKMREALRAHPGCTATELAEAAGIARSTAGKILTALFEEGSLTRTAGIASGGGRPADRWSLATTDTDTRSDVTSEESVGEDAPEITQPPADANTADGTTDTSTDADTDIRTDDAAIDAQTETVGTDAQTEDDTQPDTDSDEVVLGIGKVEAGSVGGSGEPEDTAAAPSSGDGETIPATVEGGVVGEVSVKRPRLGKGALRGLVEDYLSEHAGQEFSPNVIGKALKRSSGAVANALVKLVADGYAVQTQDKPKRFAAKPQTEAPAS